jgi:hypothetical protein
MTGISVQSQLCPLRLPIIKPVIKEYLEAFPGLIEPECALSRGPNVGPGIYLRKKDH